MPMHVRFIQGNEMVADLPEWDGPIPRVGDYIFHPPEAGVTPADGGFTNVAGHVASVTWFMYERPVRKLRGEQDGFRPTSRPYVEIHFPS